MSSDFIIDLEGEPATLDLGRRLAEKLPGTPMTFYLHGRLGAGKTTLVRGILQGIGYEGPVQSPTYSLVVHYPLDGMRVDHFDLYRLGDPEELEFIGGREYFDTADLVIIEWPERGAGHIPRADVDIYLQYVDAGRRKARLTAHSDQGRALVHRLQERT